MAGVFIVEPMIKVLRVDGRKYALSHFPMMDWPSMSHESIHLHGHIHSVGLAYNELNREQGIYRYDVGVDANNFTPISIEEINDWFDGVENAGRIKWGQWARPGGANQLES